MSNLDFCVAVDELQQCNINDVFTYAKAIQEEFIIKESEEVKAEVKAEVNINACVKLFIKAQSQVFTRMEADVLQEFSTAADEFSMNSSKQTKGSRLSRYLQNNANPGDLGDKSQTMWRDIRGWDSTYTDMATS